MRHGFLLIRKPKGPTSHDVVAIVRKTLSERDIGHLGTLDPAAEGLMVLAVGSKALKVIELFSKLSKDYVAEITLGKISDTFDGEGRISDGPIKAGWNPPEDSSKIQALIDDVFVGKIAQVPPAYSALKIDGIAAHRRARGGQELKMQAREVEISDCKVLDYLYPRLRLNVRCGAGTYIRSLANDLGEKLRCGGYLSALLRTRVGDWKIDDAVAPEAARWTDVLPLKDILKSFSGIELSAEQWEHLRHGRSIPAVSGQRSVISDQLVGWFEGLPVVLLEADPKKEGMMKARKVL